MRASQLLSGVACCASEAGLGSPGGAARAASSSLNRIAAGRNGFGSAAIAARENCCCASGRLKSYCAAAAICCWAGSSCAKADRKARGFRRRVAYRGGFSSLSQRVKSQDAPPDEYEIHVYAFDGAGKLVTESKADSAHAFWLTGATRLGKEQRESSGGPNPIVISEEYEANERLLARADDLLDQKQFDEARRTLDQVTKDAPRGHALTSRARMAALQGDCVTALALADQADAEGGTCGLIEARQLCAAPQRR